MTIQRIKTLLPFDHTTFGTLLTLVIATMGGWLGHWLAADAGWLLGALLATLAGAFKGFPLRYASCIQSGVIVLAGVSAGSMLQPGMLHGITHWAPSLAGLFISLLLTITGVTYFLHHYGSCEQNTSVLAAYPGHMMMIMQLAIRHTCDIHKVTTIQSLRMLFLVLSLPALAFIWMPEQPTMNESTDYIALGLLSLAGVAGVILARLLNIPASLLIGSMGGSGLAALSGTSIGVLPDALKVCIFVLTGAMIGTRFVNTHWSAIYKILPVALTSMSITMLISAAIAVPVAWITDVPVMQLLLAYSPGGAEVMSLIALAIGHDPAFVGFHHIIRLLAMAAFFPLLIRFAIR